MTRISRSASSRYAPRLRLALALTASVLAVEVAGGLLSGSLALLADAGHVLTDAIALGLNLLAIRLASRPADPQRTYGYYRLEILAAFLNAVLLLGVAAGVLAEAWHRFFGRPPVEGGLMLAAGLVGLAANAVAVRILHGGREASLNVRGAYLEVLGDLLGGAAVVAAATIIATTGATLADPIAAALVGVLILPRIWRLLRDATDVLLEAVPKGVDLEEVRQHMLGAPGVTGVHDLHAWTITSGMNVVSAHVVLEAGAQPTTVLDHLAACLRGDFDIEHSTFQLEPHDRSATEEVAHE